MPCIIFDKEEIQRASEPPIPDPFSAESMARWADYCEEMRGYEALLAEM